MTDPNGERAEKTADIIKASLLVKRYCMNPQCKSFGRKRPGVGRYLGETRLGDPARILCEDCHTFTEITPIVSEEITTSRKFARAT